MSSIYWEKSLQHIWSAHKNQISFHTQVKTARFQELLWIRGLDEAIRSSENDLKSLIYLMKEIAT